MTTVDLPTAAACPEHAFIEACRADPNPFIEYLLDVTQAQLHEQMQDHYTAHDEAGIGVPRGHGKTVQTFSRIAWEIGHDPTARVKYIQANDKEAGRSVDAIRRICEHPRYKQVFPSLVKDPTCWGTTAFRWMTPGTIQRDPTVEAVGIFGHAGGRATHLVFDDICTLENSIRKSALREQVKDAYQNTWRKMLTGDRRRVWCVFTPWHEADITATWRREFGKRGTLMWRPCLEGWLSPWPEEFTPERLQYEYDQGEDKGPVSYARAYLLEPFSSETLIFPAEWLEAAFYVDRPQFSQSGSQAMTMDFAFTEKAMMPANPSADPDFSVALFAHLDRRGHVWVEDMYRDRVQFPQFKREALARARARSVTKGRAEAVAGQRGLVQQVNEESGFPVEAVDRLKDKSLRGIGLQSFVSTGRFHILCTREHGVLVPIPQLAHLFNEMVMFPNAAHDDTVDTAMDMMEMALSSAPPIRSDPTSVPVRPKPQRAQPVHDNPRVRQLYGP